MKSLQITFILLLILAVGVRLLLSFLYPPQFKNGQYVNFQTTLLNEPVNHGYFETMTVSFTNGFSSVPLSLAFPVGNNLHYGQSVAISGKIKVKVLGNKKVITTISSPHFKINSTSRNFLFSSTFFLRQKIKQLYEKIFSQRLAALLLGIVLGVKGNFPKDFLKDLQATGVMHVIAASGMNVTMVGGFLLGLFTLFLKRQWAIAVTIVALLFYCVLSGLQASIVRATIMIVFALAAQFLGRQYSGLYGLILAACAMLLYNPAWVFDIGFELSFAATLGIFFIKPLLPQWKLITDDIGTTIAAQIATLPILVGSFGTYGLLSVFVNALVLWTIPLLMILGGIGAVIALVLEPVGRLVILLCFPFLVLFEKVIEFFGSFNWQINISEVPISMTIGYYLVIISIILFLKQRKNQKIMILKGEKAKFLKQEA